MLAVGIVPWTLLASTRVEDNAVHHPHKTRISASWCRDAILEHYPDTGINADKAKHINDRNVHSFASQYPLFGAVYYGCQYVLDAQENDAISLLNQCKTLCTESPIPLDPVMCQHGCDLGYRLLASMPSSAVDGPARSKSRSSATTQCLGRSCTIL